MDKENCLIIPDTSINENISDLPNDTAGKSSVAPKSRYGRVHKPKIVGDFLSTDKKVAAILGLSSTGSSTQKNSPTLDTQTNAEDNLHVKSKTFSYNVETDSCLPKIHQDIHENTLKEKPKMCPRVETVSETIPATTSVLIKDPKDGSLLSPPLPKRELPPCTWDIGDLLWARVGGHPFWPCIVVEDLTLSVFTKVKAFGGSRKLQRYFHVQFYGDNGRRSWVPASGLIPYEGVEAFNKLSEETLSKLKKYERKQATAFIVRPTSRIKWDVSVQESEQAFHLSRTQRIQEFSLKYPQTMSIKQEQISEPFLSEQSKKPLKKPLKRKAEETPSPKKRKYVKKVKLNLGVVPLESNQKLLKLEDIKLEVDDQSSLQICDSSMSKNLKPAKHSQKSGQSGVKRGSHSSKKNTAISESNSIRKYLFCSPSKGKYSPSKYSSPHVMDKKNKFGTPEKGTPVKKNKFLTPEKGTPVKKNKFLTPEKGTPTKKNKLVTPEKGTPVKKNKFVTPEKGTSVKKNKFVTPETTTSVKNNLVTPEKGTPVKNNLVTPEKGTPVKNNFVTLEKGALAKKNIETPEKDTPVKKNIVTPEKDTLVKKNIVTVDQATPLVRKKRLSKVDLEDASVVNKRIIDFDDDFVMNKDSTDDDEDYIPSKSKRKTTENVSYSDPSHSKISVKTRVKQQSKNRKFSTLIEDEAFLRYYDSHIDMVLDEHPQWTTEQIDTYVITNWKWVEDSKKVIFNSKVESEAEARRFGNNSEDNAEKPRSTLFRKGGQFSARREKSYSKLQMAKDDDSDSIKVKKLENNLLSDNVKTEKEMEESIPATPSSKDKKSPSLFKGMKNEKVCQICEKAGDVMRCKGPCLGVFHLNCLAKQQSNLKSKLLVSNSDLKAISPLAGDNSCADVTEDENNYARSMNHKSNVQINDKDTCEDKTVPEFSDMNETFHKNRQENNLSDSAFVSNKNVNVKTKHSLENNIANTINKTVTLPSKTVSSGVISNDNIPGNTSSNDETRSVCSKNTDMKNIWSVKNSLVMGTGTMEQVNCESGDNSEDSENEPFPGFELQDLSPKIGKNALLKYDVILPTKASPLALSETKRGKATEDSTSVRLSSASFVNSDRSRCTPTKQVELAKQEANVVNDDSDTKGGKASAKAKREKKKKEDESEEEKVGADFLCSGCSQNLTPPCFVCGQELHPVTKEDMRQRCAIVQCGKFYHLSCANEWPQTWFSKNGSSRLSTKQPAMTCPQHTCHTCASDDPRNINMRFTNEKLVRCIYCPTTYHYGNHCIPAGSDILNTTQMVCPKHYKPKRKGIHHVNVSWCSICTEGGSLMCCDICPNSFHAHCLVMPVPEGGYTCEDCQTGRFPLYGEVVWVKLGAYRWWPAQILFPHEIPENIRNLSHVRGEFAVKFFGSHDHYWVNRGRVFIYQVGDTGSKSRAKSSMDAVYDLAVVEALEAQKVLEAAKATREAEPRQGMKPPMYVKIKTNKPVGNVRMLEPDHSNLTPCDCDPFSEQPCDSDSNCLNRILLVECSPTVCKAGDKCRNQRFEKREYPPLTPYKTDGRGWGLKTLADIHKGDFIIEYVGEVIDESEYKHRIDNKHNEKDQNFYFLTIDKDRMIDAGPKGNFARFMNHSCQPNCETQKWTVNGDTRVGLFAIDDIPANSELTFNYNLQCVGPDKKPCMCGAPNCSGYIGSKATKLVEEDKKKLRADLTKSGKKWKNRRGGGLSAWKMGVEECFLCGKSGDLIDCYNKTCPKSYHLECVDLKKPPKERWICPWHCCDICEKRTSQRCSICTSAFCPAHSDGNLHFDSNQSLVCNKHSKSVSTSVAPGHKPEEIVTHSDEVVETISDKVVETISDKVVETISDKVVETISDKVVEAISDKAVDIISDKVVKTISDKVVETISDKVVETISEEVVETISEEDVETISDKVVETISDKVVDIISDEVMETGSDEVVETISDEVLETKADEVVETGSYKIVVTKSEKVVETKPEEVVEAKSEKVVETKFEEVLETAFSNKLTPSQEISVQNDSFSTSFSNLPTSKKVDTLQFLQSNNTKSSTISSKILIDLRAYSDDKLNGKSRAVVNLCFPVENDGSLDKDKQIVSPNKDKMQYKSANYLIPDEKNKDPPPVLATNESKVLVKNKSVHSRSNQSHTSLPSIDDTIEKNDSCPPITGQTSTRQVSIDNEVILSKSDKLSTLINECKPEERDNSSENSEVTFSNLLNGDKSDGLNKTIQKSKSSHTELKTNIVSPKSNFKKRSIVNKDLPCEDFEELLHSPKKCKQNGIPKQNENHILQEKTASVSDVKTASLKHGAKYSNDCLTDAFENFVQTFDMEVVLQPKKLKVTPKSSKTKSGSSESDNLVQNRHKPQRCTTKSKNNSLFNYFQKSPSSKM